MLPDQKGSQEPNQEQDEIPYLPPEEIRGSPFNPDLTDLDMMTAFSELKKAHLADLKEKQEKNLQLKGIRSGDAVPIGECYSCKKQLFQELSPNHSVIHECSGCGAFYEVFYDNGVPRFGVVPPDDIRAQWLTEKRKNKS